MSVNKKLDDAIDWALIVIYGIVAMSAIVLNLFPSLIKI